MNRRKSILILTIIVVLAGTMLFSCSASDAPEVEDVSEMVSQSEPLEEPGTSEEQSQSSDEQDVDVAMASEENSQCLSCHTNQQRLTNTADPVVEVESENTGEG